MRILRRDTNSNKNQPVKCEGCEQEEELAKARQGSRDGQMLKAALPIIYFLVRPPWCGMSSYGSIVADLSSFNFSVLLILLLYLGF